MGNDNDIEWAATPAANLVRRCGEIYYAQIKIAGKVYRRSLGTDKLKIARMKLPVLLNEMRARAEGVAMFEGEVERVAAGRGTLRGCVSEWIEGQRVRPDLKAASKRFNERRAADLLRTLPVEKGGAVVGVQDLRRWWQDMAEHYNPMYANALLSVVKVLVGMQVAAGVRAQNIVSDFKRMRLVKKLRWLPSGEEMTALILDIRMQGRGWSDESADMVSMMAYTGMRPEEVVQLQSGDLLQDVIAVRMGVRGTKNYEERTVPIMAELRDVVDRRREMVGSLWSIKSPRKAMDRACARLGMERVTRYLCRHFFATRCLESGVDVPTVARWLGHRDGGITLMKTYSHVTDAHGLEAAKRVRLG